MGRMKQNAKLPGTYHVRNAFNTLISIGVTPITTYLPFNVSKVRNYLARN